MIRKKHALALLMFIGFGYIAFGLGYASLNRYDPSNLDFLSDTKFYFDVVEQGIIGVSHDSYGRSARLLHPLIAHGFFQYIPSFGSWNMVAFAMLAVNSIFVSLTALVIFNFASRLGNDQTVAFIAALIFLCNFATVNFFLAGLVDSSFCLVFLIFLLSIFYRKHLLVAPLFIIGTLFKELMLPFGAVFTSVYFIADAYQKKRFDWRLGATFLLGIVASFIVVIALQSFAAGGLVFPWGHAANLYEPLTAPIFWDPIGTLARFGYVFFLILPLGLFELRRLPLPFMLAVLSLPLLMVFFAIWVSMDGSGVARALFSACGPIMCILAAANISRYLSKLSS